MMLTRLTSLIVALGLLAGPFVSSAQTPVDGPPFSLPFTDPPGPNTWLYNQHYGNTTQSFNFGDVWYQFGQGMHFGVDFEAPCGTPVHAIADGVVVVVDASGFGAGPHNLVLDHPGTGYTSLYGHLLEPPALTRGQEVKRGEQIGLSGDPDGSCGSRPHLHLEIRSSDFQTAYDPVPFFDVNWHMLISIGPNNTGFQQDLDTPHRWMKIEDQPDIHFSGDILNDYLHPWPPRLEVRAPVNSPLDRHLDPPPENAEITRTAVSVNAWNIGAWWNPRDLDAVYLIDAVPGQPTGVFRQPLDGSPRQYVQPAPPDLFSPDGTITVERTPDAYIHITRLTDGMAWQVETGGYYPAVSPDNTRLLWEIVYGDIVPGTSTPPVAMMVSNIDGSLVRRVYTQSGGYSLWLDAHRLLIVKRPPFTAASELYILDIDDPEMIPEPLGVYPFLHGLKVAPGGGMIAFFLPFQDNPDDSGVYVQRTEPGSTPHKLAFFGAYQWRDDSSLYTLSYDIHADAHALGVVDVTTGDLRWLTDPADLPIRVANGEWSVSPDGTRIIYVDPSDYGMYLLTIPPTKP
jgi:murein DD-endopeptidase MepM/ murein hydrolase activator NlpD